MKFSHYSDQAAGLAADLVNTRGSITGNDYLQDTATLKRFLDEHGFDSPGRITERDLEDVRELRARLKSVFEAEDESRASRILNDLLAQVGTIPQLTDHDGEWHVHYVSPDAPLADRIAAAAGMGLAAVMAEFGKDRFGMCAAQGCRDVFVDTSKNRSRRYCNETCSSRTNVAAYRARRKHPAG